MESYRVLILGDFHFGENYSEAGAQILQKFGYSHSTVHLRRFIDTSDAFVVNLETPLVDPEDSPSGLVGRKKYIHWADPRKSGAALRDLGVDAVSLANNHTLDHGPEGLESTFQTLSDLEIAWFGAGRSLDEARTPYRLTLPARIGGGEIHFHGSFQYSTRHDLDFGFYADEHSPGCAPLSVGAVPDARSASAPEDSFQVAFPHWGANYAWRGHRQYRLAHRFLNKEYDLVLGHGGHSPQEVHRKRQRWVIFGLGDGIFQAIGKWRQYEEQAGILPFSLWAVLEVQKRGRARRVKLKLYPVYAENLFTNFQPCPVTSADFDRVVETLSGRAARPWRFNNSARATGEDDLGLFIELDLGEWKEGRRPALLAASVDGGDPGEWPLRGPNTEIEDEMLSLNRHMGVGGLALAAQADGASVLWLGWGLALIESRGKRILAQRYRAHESSLGDAISRDKLLTAELLRDDAIPTPTTVPVDSPDDAIEAARKIRGPVVIKPRDGNRSRGVSTNLVSEDEIREAYASAREYGAEVILQEHIQAADELRVMASPDRAVAVIKRVLPHVVGDGDSTIGELIEDKNLQRTLSPSLRSRLIPVDVLTKRHLHREGLALHDVVELGRMVTVRNVGGLSAGADGFQSLEVAEPRIKEAASSAVAAIPGLGWGGVDLIVEKGTGTPYVIEINTSAAYGAALFPTYGQPLNVAEEVWKLRYAATAWEPTSVPHTPDPRTVPISVAADPALVQEGGVVTFEALFERFLIRQGYIISPRNQRVLQVTPHQGGDMWVTRAGQTAADRSGVEQVMRRHEWVCQLLDISKVPRTRSRSITSTRQLRHFVEGRVRKILLAPVSVTWGELISHVLSGDEALDLTSLPGEMWVQARPSGRRLRVLATREKSWLVTATSHTRPLSSEAIAAAGRLAVEAVRAIPELRWAAVDILMRPRRVREDRPGGVLVEGLTMNPDFSAQDQIIAGDFDEFAQEVINVQTGELSLV